MSNSTTGSPQALVAVARAAWIAGDRDLLRAARAELESRFGITLKFKNGHVGHQHREPHADVREAARAS